VNTELNNHPGAHDTAAAAIKHDDSSTPDQTVDPKLLFHFLNPFRHSYVQWMGEVRRQVVWAEAIGLSENTHDRDIVSVDGKDAFTRGFANWLALKTPGLPAILLRIAIQESFDHPYPSIDWFLDHYRALVIYGRTTTVSASALHEFLQVDEELDPWVKRLRKALQIKFRRDYGYVIVFGSPTVGRQTDITIPMAERIVMATGTPRALKAQKLLAEAEARRKACKEAGY
jgi:phage anti-repressor protein